MHASSNMDVGVGEPSSPRANKGSRRKSLLRKTLLRNAERSSVITGDAGSGLLGLDSGSGSDEAKELWLIQMPREVDPRVLNGVLVRLRGTEEEEEVSVPCRTSKGEGNDVLSLSASKATKTTEQNRNVVLLPTAKPGRLAPAGAPIKGQMCVTQVLRVPPVKPPSSSQDKDREEDGTVTVAMPSGLKERWKPFGWKKPMRMRSKRLKHKHKKSKKHKQ